MAHNNRCLQHVAAIRMMRKNNNQTHFVDSFGCCALQEADVDYHASVYLSKHQSFIT